MRQSALSWVTTGGELAYVPKLKGKTGESCSVLSWETCATMANPYTIGSDTVLRVDAGFVSGTAANVAAAPDESTIHLEADPAASGGKQMQLETHGKAGARISSALFAMATLRELSPDLQARREALAQKLDALDETKATAVLSGAGYTMKAGMTAKESLRSAVSHALDDASITKLEAAFGRLP